MMRKASVRWTGGARDGSGAMTTESGMLKQTRYSSGTPFKKSNRTNPAELIAAAHAASFSMALANELGTAGFVPNHIATSATVTLERLAAGWTMTRINLEVLAEVPKAAQSDFIDATLRAKTGCPISRLLRVNISMHAKLESNALAVALPRPPNQNNNLPARNNRTRSRKPQRPPPL
jgi:osmotically inducible protein OsmC